MSDLTGRVALITGAGRGIGKAIAQELAGKGMLVAVNDYDATTAQVSVDELAKAGCRALAVPCDVSDKEQVQAMFERIEEELGPLWLLVNNAGVYTAAPTETMPVEMWDRTFSVDARGVFLTSQAAIQRMIPRKGGRIVNISSIAGHIVRTAQIAYCSAKAAAIHFTRCLAVEVAPHGITVNCLCPGMTWTTMLSTTAIERHLDLDAMVALIPSGRMANEIDHAHLVAFFASDEAAHVTGQVVSVDGAQSLFHPLAAVRIEKSS